jgi:hypothetical protein
MRLSAVESRRLRLRSFARRYTLGLGAMRIRASLHISVDNQKGQRYRTPVVYQKEALWPIAARNCSRVLLNCWF